MPYDDDITPARVWRGFWTWIGTGIAAAALIVGVIVGGAHLGWWLQGQAANHQAVNTQNGYANQTTLRQQVTSNLATVTTLTTQITGAGSDQSMVTALKAQRMAIAGTVCQDAEQVTDGLPADQSQWVAANCADGSVSPSSPVYQAGQP